MKKITLLIGGMHCASCSSLLERDFNSAEGINNAVVSIATEKATLEYDDTVISYDDIVNIVKRDGFFVTENAAEQKKNQLNDLRKRFTFAVVFSVPLLIIAMAPMLKIPFFIDPMKHAVIYAFVQLILCIPVIICGISFYINGFKQLFLMHPNMDTLIAIGTSSAFLYSCYSFINILTGNHMYAHSLYFESSAVIITLVLLGKLLEERSKGKTGEAIKALMELTPMTAFVERDGEATEIPVEQVQTDDIIRVFPGGKFPVDGIVIEGGGAVDESMLTGESMPVDVTVGSAVTGATVSVDGYFRIRATKVGNDTTLSQIIKLVEDAQGSKAPIAKLADKVALIFVPSVIGIAVLAFYLWLAVTRDFAFSFGIFIAVLVIACPCALGLATPTAITVGTGTAAKHGILFKNAESLQLCRRADTIVMDKTGTLTEGKPVVTDVIYTDVSEAELIRITATLEQYSEHPIASAIVKLAKSKGINSFEAENVKVVSGFGISGSIGGLDVKAGNAAFTGATGNSVSRQLAEQGKTLVYVTAADKLMGIFAVADVIKKDSAAAVADLEKMGFRTVMLTGDNSVTANVIARRLGIDSVYAQVLPQDKAGYVAKFMAEGRKVLMVGDGINDAPALTRADIGIAVGNGTDIAIECADVVLVRGSLFGVAEAVRISRAVMRNIKQNLFWAFCYNCLGIPVAAGVLYIFGGPLLNPMIAAAAMSLSSVSVVLNALRLSRIKLK